MISVLKERGWWTLMSLDDEDGDPMGEKGERVENDLPWWRRNRGLFGFVICSGIIDREVSLRSGVDRGKAVMLMAKRNSAMSRCNDLVWNMLIWLV